MLRTAVLAVLCALLVPGVAAAQRPEPPPPPSDAPRVLLAFIPGRETGPQTKVILKRFEKRPELALGFVSSTTGRYDATQSLLDISQGTRTSFNVYNPTNPPEIALVPYRGGGFIAGWFDVLRRAEATPERIEPGLLGSLVPGGAGYVGIIDQPNPVAIPAANRNGRIPGLSLDSPETVVQRTRAMLVQRRFVVAYLPTRRAGGRALDALLTARRPNELLIVMRAPPTESASVLLPVGIVGLGTGNLTSATSRGEGLIAAIDILPTALDHLGVAVPESVKGQPIRVGGERDADALLEFEKRSRVVAPRRIPTLQAVLLGWLGVVLLFGAISGPSGVRRGMRVGGLAALWTPAVLLIPAAFQPTRQAELGIVIAAALGLGALTDLLVRWPRAPIVVALATLAAYTVDLALGSDLTIRSLLGPNPRFGSRFYGLGNELEAVLPVVVLAGLAAAPGLRERSRRSALAFALGGLVLGVIVGSGRLGADVGGVVTVGAGFAVATVLMLPGEVTWRRIALVLAAPLVALALLAGIDVVTGGNSHFSRTVLGAGSLDELWKTAERRYELAYQQLIRGLMPVLTVLALLAAIYGIRFRRTLLTPVEYAPAWSAAMIGGLAGSLAGALTNDSGPLIVVFGVISLAFVVVYVRGDPRLVPTAPSLPAAAREAEEPGEPPTREPVETEPVEAGSHR